jgi:hypothetical protein
MKGAFEMRLINLLKDYTPREPATTRDIVEVTVIIFALGAAVSVLVWVIGYVLGSLILA